MIRAHQIWDRSVAHQPQSPNTPSRKQLSGRFRGVGCSPKRVWGRFGDLLCQSMFGTSRLPAITSLTAATAATAATSATATATATASRAAAAAAAASATVAAAATTTLSWFSGLCFVDDQCSTVEFRAVERFDRRLATFVFHCDESEPARPTRLAISDHGHFLYLPMRTECRLERVLSGVVIEVPYIQFHGQAPIQNRGTR